MRFTSGYADTVQYRQLGATGVTLSAVGFGCGRQAQLMIGDDEELRLDAIRVALAGGINYFDTADSYGAGRADLNLASAFRRLDVSPSIIAKVTLEPADLKDPRAAALRRFEGCLRRLERDQVAVLMLHNQVFDSVEDGERGPVGAKLSLGHVFDSSGVAVAFQEVLASGRAQAVAFTAFGGDLPAIREMIGSDVFGALNVTFNLLNPSAAIPVRPGLIKKDFGAIIETSAQRGLGVMAISVLVQGALGADSMHEGHDRRVVSTALKHAESLPIAATRYVLSKPAVSTAVLGFSCADHVRAALRAVGEGSLSDEAIAEIEAVAGA